MVIADFNPQVSGRGKTILLAFFKLFEMDNLNFFSFDQNELLKKVGFERIETFPVLASMFQITLAQRISDWAKSSELSFFQITKN